MATLLSTTNGGTVADATDNVDAMDKLIDFLTGVTGTLPALQQWTVLKDVVISPFGAALDGRREVYLRGPGLAGLDTIYINIAVYDNAVADARNWQIKAATGFNTLNDFDNQPGTTNIGSYLTLNDDTAMPFWFIANGRRFICVFKIVNTYVACYCGFYLPYATPSEQPYPIIAGANTEGPTNLWSRTNYTMGNFYDGPAAGGNACGHIRHFDGSWRRVGNFNASNVASRPGSSNSQCRSNLFFENRGDQFIIQASDNTYPVIPSTLYINGSIYGEYDGVYWTPSRDNATENTVTVGADTYLVIQNVYRTTEVNCAILLE